MSGPQDNRPGSGPPPPPTPPPREIRPLVFTPEILAAAAAAPRPSPERLARVAAILGPRLARHDSGRRSGRPVGFAAT